MQPGAIPLAVVHSYLDQWLSAVELQRDRLLNDATGGVWLADGAFFAFALRNLLRAVEVAQQVSGADDVADALAEFHHAVPAAKELRDVLEHFDRYWLGLGDLQHPSRPRRARRAEEASDPWKDHRRRHAPPGSFGFQVWRTNGSFVIAAGELTVDVVSASDSARTLAERVRETLGPATDRGGQKPNMFRSTSPASDSTAGG